MMLIVLLILSLSCFAISLIVGFSTYYAGYVPRIAWNEDLVETNCVVTRHKVEKTLCNFDCDCYKECADDDDDTTCHQRCNTCQRDCWATYYNLDYKTFPDPNNRNPITVFNPENPNNGTDNGEVTYGSTIYYRSFLISESNAKSELERAYPIGSSWTCYYHQSEPTKMVTTKYNEKGFQEAGIVFFVFMGISGAASIIITLIMAFGG